MSLRMMKALQADLASKEGIGYLASVLGRMGKRTRSGTESEAATTAVEDDTGDDSEPTQAVLPTQQSHKRQRLGKAERAKEKRKNLKKMRWEPSSSSSDVPAMKKKKKKKRRTVRKQPESEPENVAEPEPEPEKKKKKRRKKVRQQPDSETEKEPEPEPEQTKKKRRKKVHQQKPESEPETMPEPEPMGKKKKVKKQKAERKEPSSSSDDDAPTQPIIIIDPSPSPSLGSPMSIGSMSPPFDDSPAESLSPSPPPRRRSVMIESSSPSPSPPPHRRRNYVTPTVDDPSTSTGPKKNVKVAGKKGKALQKHQPSVSAIPLLTMPRRAAQPPPPVDVPDDDWTATATHIELE
jgi:hypothetical protein